MGQAASAARDGSSVPRETRAPVSGSGAPDKSSTGLKSPGENAFVGTGAGARGQKCTPWARPALLPATLLIENPRHASACTTLEFLRPPCHKPPDPDTPAPAPGQHGVVITTSRPLLTLGGRRARESPIVSRGTVRYAAGGAQRATVPHGIRAAASGATILKARSCPGPRAQRSPRPASCPATGLERRLRSVLDQRVSRYNPLPDHLCHDRAPKRGPWRCAPGDSEVQLSPDQCLPPQKWAGFTWNRPISRFCYSPFGFRTPMIRFKSSTLAKSMATLPLRAPKVIFTLVSSRSESAVAR